MYIPIGKLSVLSGSGGQGRHQVGAGYMGVRFMVPLMSRVMLEMHGGYAPTLVAVHDPDATTNVADHRAGLIMSSVRAVLWLQPRPETRHWAVHLTTGVGSLARVGEAWQGIGGTNEFAVVAGAGVRLRVSDTLAFRFVVEDYLSLAHIRGGGVPDPAPRLHHDTVWSVGVLVPVGRP